MDKETAEQKWGRESTGNMQRSSKDPEEENTDETPEAQKGFLESLKEYIKVIESLRESIGIEEGSPQEAKRDDSSSEQEGCIFDLDSVKEALGLIDTPEEAVDETEMKGQSFNEK